jgi:hypothetical protein
VNHATDSSCQSHLPSVQAREGKNHQTLQARATLKDSTRRKILSQPSFDQFCNQEVEKNERVKPPAFQHHLGLTEVLQKVNNQKKKKRYKNIGRTHGRIKGGTEMTEPVLNSYRSVAKFRYSVRK